MGRLFWKFFFAFWISLLLAGAGVGAAVWLHQQSLGEDTRHIDTHGHAKTLVSAASATLRNGGITALHSLLREWNREFRHRLYAVDEHGRELLNRQIPPDLLEEALRRVGDGVLRVDGGDGHRYLLFTAVRQPAFPPPPPANGMGPPPRRGGPPPPNLLIAAGIVASLAFSVWLAWYLSKPIRHLRGAFTSLAEGRLETRVAARMGKRRDEIADLGKDFDHMAEQIGSLVAAHQRLLHDVSHELRSPLARLQAAIGLVRQQPGDAEKYLARVEREAERVNELVSELLTLSRLETGMTAAASAEAFDLAELLLETVEDARFEAQARNVRVHLHAPSCLMFTGHIEPLHRAIENVVRNAVQHAPDGSLVEVVLAPAPKRLIIAVQDQGPGVPEAQLSDIFRRFFRSPGQQRKDGAGLGLAIAKLAVEIHGGSIRARNREGGGLRVEIELPMEGKGCGQ